MSQYINESTSSIKTELPSDFPSKLTLPIVHIAQQAEWDCGIACLHMLCKWQIKKITEDDVAAAVEKHSLNKEVWTIDLAYLCSMLGFKHRYCTINDEFDCRFINLPFYVNTFHNQHHDEASRIAGLYQHANEENVKMEKKPVSIKEIILHLENEKQPVIVLVNAAKLCGKKKNEVEDLCEAFDNTTLSDRIATHDISYLGHYILVIGFDMETETICFHDPSKMGANLQSSFENFETARKSFGTDQDVLFIYQSDEKTFS